MNPKKVFFLKLLVLMLALSFAGPAFSQGRPNKTIAHAGMIEWVSRDFKYIGVNESKVRITPQTKIVDGHGNSLPLSDLRPGLVVVVELIRNPNGSTERRIVIKR